MRVRKTNSALVLNSCEVIYDLSWFLWSLGHAVNTVNSKWYYTVVLYILCVIVSKYIHVFHFDCYNPVLMPSTCICIHAYVCLYVCIPGLCVLPWFIHSFIHSFSYQKNKTPAMHQMLLIKSLQLSSHLFMIPSDSVLSPNKICLVG